MEEKSLLGSLPFERLGGIDRRGWLMLTMTAI
jgi:hypothetical protein